MTYRPHLRLTFGGSIGNNEIWSCSLSMVPDDSAWAAAVEDAAQLALLTNLLVSTSESHFADLVTDVSAYVGRATTRITGKARLKSVKLAAIDTNGHYAAAPQEAAPDVQGGGGFDYLPHQCARKITLGTDGDIGRVKGGWYLPATSNLGLDINSDQYSLTETDGVRDSTLTFLQDLENVPGLDAHSFQVVVASQGRHNRDGSVRVAPANHEVKRVHVGRRVDIQRRRANKVPEAPDAWTTLE